MWGRHEAARNAPDTLPDAFSAQKQRDSFTRALPPDLVWPCLGSAAWPKTGRRHVEGTTWEERVDQMKEEGGGKVSRK